MMMTFFLLSMEVSFTVRRARSEYRVDIYLSGHLTNTPYIFVSYHAKIICTGTSKEISQILGIEAV